MPPIKLIKQTSVFNFPDDPTYPWKLHVVLRAPEFMDVLWRMLYGGTEELIVRGISKEILDEFVAEQKLYDHPRFIRLEITQPELQAA